MFDFVVLSSSNVSLLLKLIVFISINLSIGFLLTPFKPLSPNQWINSKFSLMETSFIPGQSPLISLYFSVSNNWKINFKADKSWRRFQIHNYYGQASFTFMNTKQEAMKCTYVPTHKSVKIWGNLTILNIKWHNYTIKPYRHWDIIPGPNFLEKQASRSTK